MQLRDNEIHIIAAPLAHPFPEQWLATLNDEERERAARLHLPLHQQRFTMARAILRHLLGLYLNAEPKSLTFSYGEYRKPALAGTFANQLQFNLSHSADMAMYAFILNGQIGIDIEKVRQENKSDIATRFFSTAEISALQALPPADQTAGFYCLWARKEAIIKANGKGFAQPLSSFSVSLANQPELLQIDHQSWNLYPLAIHQDYAAAVATAKPVTSLLIWDFIDQKASLRSIIKLSS